MLETPEEASCSEDRAGELGSLAKEKEEEEGSVLEREEEGAVVIPGAGWSRDAEVVGSVEEVAGIVDEGLTEEPPMVLEAEEPTLVVEGSLEETLVV